MTDFLSPIEIAPATYWVGKRDPQSIFHANPYLRIFDAAPGSGRPGGRFSLLVDPGSSSDFSIVSAKVGQLLGGLNRLSAMFINHQDPDVGSSAATISGRWAPHAGIICSEATWRLIQHYNLPRERLLATEKFVHGIKLPTGHILKPVPSPFCHFRGAVMLYDPETRVLFSGDLFGGLTNTDAKGLWADESDWSGMRAFHQIYMPANQAVRRTIEQIRKLDPFPEIIAPQHGRVIRGKMVEFYLEKLAKLPMGLDVLDDQEEGPELLGAWNRALERVMKTARMLMGAQADTRLADAKELEDTVEVRDGQPVCLQLGRWTLERAVEALTHGQPPTVSNFVKHEAILACDELHLPSPQIELDEHGADDAVPLAPATPGSGPALGVDDLRM